MCITARLDRSDELFVQQQTLPQCQKTPTSSVSSLSGGEDSPLQLVHCSKPTVLLQLQAASPTPPVRTGHLLPAGKRPPGQCKDRVRNLLENPNSGLGAQAASVSDPEILGWPRATWRARAGARFQPAFFDVFRPHDSHGFGLPELCIFRADTRRYQNKYYYEIMEYIILELLNLSSLRIR